MANINKKAAAQAPVKKGFKMPKSVTLILLITTFIALLTWIVPGTFDVTDAAGDVIGSVDEKAKLGIMDIIMAIPRGFASRQSLIFFIFILGGFIALVMKTGALEASIGALVKKLKGREILLIPIISFVFMVGGSTFGLAEETLALTAILIPVFVLAGFDAITAIMVILIAPALGVAASTVNPFALGTAVDTIGGITLGDGMVGRLMNFVVLYVASNFAFLWYAKRVKAKPETSATAELNSGILKKVKSKFNVDDIKPMTRSQKWTMAIFGGTFAFLVISVIPWTDFGINLFVDMHAKLSTWSATRWFFGSVSPLGTWWFTQLSMLFLAASLLVAIVNKYTESETISTLYAGAKDMMGVAMILAVAAALGIVLSDGGLDIKVLNSLSTVLEKQSGILLVILIFLFTLPLSILVPSTSGLAGMMFGIIGGLAVTVGGENSVELGALMATAFTLGMGCMGFILPTSSVTMGVLEIAEVPYENWIKVAWKFSAGAALISITMLALLGVIAGI